MLNANTWAFSSGPHFIAQRRSDRDSPLQTTTDTATHHHHRVVCTRARYIKYTRIYALPTNTYIENTQRERERERERRYPSLARANAQRQRAEEFFRLTDEARSSLLECHCKVQGIYVPFREPTSTSSLDTRATRRALSAAPASAPTDTYSLCFDLRRRAMRRTSIHVYIHIRSSRFKMFACTARLIK